ncbi:hypothetical protein [Rahnella sp. NRRL B-41462]|uniref:hypothetical protein n=1 Tax=Rahnella sp. NRRL B-41462 TaxID=1610579 RepID=UPI000DD4B685|nr:hypothetical protein [Rahnella sp. NRRL B-41462]
MLAPDKKVFTKKTAGEKILRNTRNRWSSQTSESMMRNGILWQPGKKTIDDYSVHNYHALRIALGKLTIQEQIFFNTLTQAPFYAVHCTDSLDVVNKNSDLILYSRKKLISKGIRFNADNTQPIDISMLGNDGYVFFSLEVGSPLLKSSSRFGSIFYKITYSHPVFRNSSMVLTDQVALVIPRCHIPELSREAVRILEVRQLDRLAIIFNGKMLSVLGLAYSIILTNRSLPVADQKIVLSARTHTELSNVVNSFYRPEIRVPKMVGIKSDEYSINMDHYKPRVMSSSESDEDFDEIEYIGSGSDYSDGED